MIPAEEFFLEETKEQKERKVLRQGVDGAKHVALKFLSRAYNLWKRSAAGDPSPTLAGRASAYLTAFTELAPVVGLNPEVYGRVLKDLTVKIGALLGDVTEASQKTVIEHRRDPKGLEVEMLQAKLKERELELREIKVAERKKEAVAAPEDDAQGKISEVADWLSKSMLGYDRQEAERRAKAAYRPEASIEEMIASACRL